MVPFCSSSAGGPDPGFQGLRLPTVHDGAGAELPERRSHGHEEHLQHGRVRPADPTRPDPTRRPPALGDHQIYSFIQKEPQRTPEEVKADANLTPRSASTRFFGSSRQLIDSILRSLDASRCLDAPLQQGTRHSREVQTGVDSGGGLTWRRRSLATAGQLAGLSSLGINLASRVASRFSHHVINARTHHHASPVLAPVLT